MTLSKRKRRSRRRRWSSNTRNNLINRSQLVDLEYLNQSHRNTGRRRRCLLSHHHKMSRSLRTMQVLQLAELPLTCRLYNKIIMQIIEVSTRVVAKVIRRMTKTMTMELVDQRMTKKDPSTKTKRASLSLSLLSIRSKRKRRLSSQIINMISSLQVLTKI